MAFYNLTKREDRDRLRADRSDELDAVKAGAWPRDLNDLMRWNMRGGSEHAGRMCEADLAYLDDVTRRLNARDPGLTGWEV